MKDLMFMLWCPEMGEGEDDAREVWGSDAEAAAEEWARREDYNSADYWIVGQGSTDVMVRDTSGATKCFRVSAEPDIHYSAREMADALDGGKEGDSGRQKQD